MIKVVILVESTSVSIKITFPPVYPLAPGSCAVTVELYEKEVHSKKRYKWQSISYAHLTLFGHRKKTLKGRREEFVYT